MGLGYIAGREPMSSRSDLVGYFRFINCAPASPGKIVELAASNVHSIKIIFLNCSATKAIVLPSIDGQSSFPYGTIRDYQVEVEVLAKFVSDVLVYPCMLGIIDHTLDQLRIGHVVGHQAVRSSVT